MAYQIDTTSQLGRHLTLLAVIDDLCTVPARSFAKCRAGNEVVVLPLGVPLCEGCDEVVADGPCACERPA
jgi:hypothetical protein